MGDIIFISHPYADDPKGNKEKVRKIIDNLAYENPQNLYICPLLTFDYIEQETPSIRQKVMEFCYKMIDCSNEVYIYGDSEGCRKELLYAWENKKKVVDKRCK